MRAVDSRNGGECTASASRAGISGAPEHVEGIRAADLIVAINTDPQAPIFNVAHYAIVADVLDILPALTESVRARKESEACRIP